MCASEEEEPWQHLRREGERSQPRGDRSAPSSKTICSMWQVPESTCEINAARLLETYEGRMGAQPAPGARHGSTMPRIRIKIPESTRGLDKGRQDVMRESCPRPTKVGGVRPATRGGQCRCQVYQVIYDSTSEGDFMTSKKMRRTAQAVKVDADRCAGCNTGSRKK